eukprot:353706-Chlamydomonas_euryale.AAC.10
MCLILTTGTGCAAGPSHQGYRPRGCAGGEHRASLHARLHVSRMEAAHVQGGGAAEGPAESGRRRRVAHELHMEGACVPLSNGACGWLRAAGGGQARAGRATDASRARGAARSQMCGCKRLIASCPACG